MANNHARANVGSSFSFFTKLGGKLEYRVVSATHVAKVLYDRHDTVTFRETMSVLAARKDYAANLARARG